MQLSWLLDRYRAGFTPIPFDASDRVIALALISGFVLTPVAVLAAVFGAWRLGAYPGWTSDFFIVDGLFSRYQMWFAVAIGAQISALILNRWVASRQRQAPELAPQEI
jgi:hypothetical protein